MIGHSIGFSRLLKKPRPPNSFLTRRARTACFGKPDISFQNFLFSPLQVLVQSSHAPVTESRLMQIDVRAQGFVITAAIETHLRRQLGFGLDHLHDRIRRVVVRLADINSRRGGMDKRCQLQVQLTDSSDVVIAEVQPNLYDAVSHAVDRAAGAIGRRLDHSRHRQRDGKPGESRRSRRRESKYWA